MTIFCRRGLMVAMLCVVGAVGNAAEAPLLEEVTVTGTHIRGSTVPGAKIVTIGRDDIERSGYGRVADVLETLPQNFSGVSEDFSQTGVLNFNRGTEIQLRGLGPGTTLTLVNGRRQASGGTRGAFVDISSIASSAVERIEVLADGASAIYGSDAIGGVVNIILRKDLDGAETRARLSTAGGEADETQLSQLLGKAWASGHAMFGYQYYERGELPASSRPGYATSGDLRSIGGSDFRLFNGNPGTILNPATSSPAFAIPAGQDGTDLAPGDLIAGANYADLVSNYFILPQQDSHTAFLSASQEVGERVELFVDGRYSKRDMRTLTGGYRTTLSVPSTNPFYVNPFGTTANVAVAYDFSNDLGPQTELGETTTYTTALGGTLRIADDWRATFTGSYSREENRWDFLNIVIDAAANAALRLTDPATALNVFGDGAHNNPATLAAIRGSNSREATSSVQAADVLVDGPLWQLPGGAMRIAFGAGYTDEGLDGAIIVKTGGAISANRAFDVSRNMRAAFVELEIPLFGADNARTGLQRLELSLASRYERYNDWGSTFDPKLGLSWQPLNALALRGTWGTAFRAPPFYQIDGSVGTLPSAFNSTTPDPKSTAANGRSNILVLGGANPDVQEETATVWTAGFDVTLPSPSWPTLSLTYFDADYRDKVANAGPQNSILTLEDQWAAVITRNPTPEQVQAVCGQPTFRGSCVGSFAAILDLRSRNLASVKVSGIDLDLSQTLPTSRGVFGVRLGGTYLREYLQAVTDAAPATDVVDTVGNPLKLRLRGTVSWAMRGWSTAVTLNHIGAYVQPGPTARAVDSLTTVDLNVGFRTGAGSGWLTDTGIALTAVNLFDEDPPFVNQYGAYDFSNHTLIGRLLSVQLTKDW